jgi:uncharacterized membrane protein YwaF
VIGLAVCIFVLYKVRNVKSKTGDRILFFCGIILAVFEVYKQFFYYYNSGQKYPWHIFPFQLCSVPMYLCIALPLIKSQKLKQVVYDFLFVFSTLGGVMVLLVPSGVMSSYLTINIHSFVWHVFLVFIGLFTAISGKAKSGFKNYRNAVFMFLFLALVAFVINCIFTEVSNGEITMFFIGPNVPQVIVFKDIALNCGWFVATLLYLPCVCLGGFLVFLPYHYICSHRD